MASENTVAPPVTWLGSKSRLVKSIVKHFPEHHTFVDVFGGSGAVLLGKKPSKIEVYNDLNKKMVALFRVLSNKSKTKELIKRLYDTPYSREFFLCSLQAIEVEQDDIELAKLLIVTQRQSHGGFGKQWSYCIDAIAGGYSASVRKYHAGIGRLKDIHERIRRAQIENLCFKDILPRYDRVGTLFYLDPPYVPETRINGRYEIEMDTNDHVVLVDLLLNLKGMCVLSGYSTPIYSPLELAGWQKVEIATYAGSSQFRTKRTECLWISPNCLKTKVSHHETTTVDSLNLSNRQKAIFRIHAQRKADSEEKITNAIRSLKRINEKVSKVAVANITGISREHITRYYTHLF
jgi:DNA adenine methylase